MNIVFCTDNNYVMPCGITMVSLLENNKGEDVTIHIVGMNLNEENKNILKSITDKYDSQIRFYNIDKSYLDTFQLSPNGGQHINIATYISLFLSEILTPSLEKVLYLDCDLMILDNISDLWNTDINNHSLAGVIDRPIFEPKTFKDLKYDDKYPYINAGVMLINLKYWRTHNVQSRLLEYSKNNYDNIHRYDQDIINGVLHKSILIVHIRYNMHNFFFWRKCNARQYQNDVVEALKNPAIIHFTTSMKPWLRGSVHPMRKEYLKYKNLSVWGNRPLTWGNISFSRKVRYYKRLILDTLGIKKHKYIKIN